MGRDIKITRITVTQYRYEIENMAMEETLGFDRIYKAGSRLELVEEIVSIDTDAGITGSEVGGVDAASAGYLLGRNPFDRDAIWRDLNRGRLRRATIMRELFLYRLMKLQRGPGGQALPAARTDPTLTYNLWVRRARRLTPRRPMDLGSGR